MASYTSYGFCLEENERNGAQRDQSAYSTNRKHSVQLSDDSSGNSSTNSWHLCVKTPESTRGSYTSTLYPTNSTAWLGVSRRDPRLKLPKYREYIISKTQGAGDAFNSASYSENSRVSKQNTSSNDRHQKASPRRGPAKKKVPGIKCSKKRTRPKWTSLSVPKTKKRALKVASENFADADNIGKKIFPNHTGEDDMEATETAPCSLLGHSIRPSISDISLPTISPANLRLTTKENGGITILGKGVYGFVVRAKLVENGIEHDVVAKFFKEDKNSVEDVLDEARILHYLWDTGVVPRVYGVLHSEQLSSRPILVQECFGDGQDLYNLLESSPPKNVWIKACIAAAEALEKIHAKGVLLNDIKPDNILIDNKFSIRYIDMGMATLNESFLYPTGPLLSKCRHLAPEVKRGEPTRITSDIFSFGIVLRSIGKDGNVPDLVASSHLLTSADPLLRCSLTQVITLLKSLDYADMMEF